MSPTGGCIAAHERQPPSISRICQNKFVVRGREKCWDIVCLGFDVSILFPCVQQTSSRLGKVLPPWVELETLVLRGCTVCSATMFCAVSPVVQRTTRLYRKRESININRRIFMCASGRGIVRAGAHESPIYTGKESSASLPARVALPCLSREAAMVGYETVIRYKYFAHHTPNYNVCSSTIGSGGTVSTMISNILEQAVVDWGVFVLAEWGRRTEPSAQTVLLPRPVTPFQGHCPVVLNACKHHELPNTCARPVKNSTPEAVPRSEDLL